MALSIRIGNLNKKRKISRETIKKAARAVLKKFDKKNASLEITFVSNERIKSLNKKYMGRPRSTDVLAFGLEKAPLVGDIYISSDMARENSRVYGTCFKREITLYVIHGVLHLMGIRDKTQSQKKQIRKMEARFLESIR